MVDGWKLDATLTKREVLQIVKESVVVGLAFMLDLFRLVWKAFGLQCVCDRRAVSELLYQQKPCFFNTGCSVVLRL
jgi:hypothetical protein